MERKCLAGAISSLGFKTGIPMCAAVLLTLFPVSGMLFHMTAMFFDMIMLRRTGFHPEHRSRK
jgi:hypothetical protein